MTSRLLVLQSTLISPQPHLVSVTCCNVSVMYITFDRYVLAQVRAHVEKARVAQKEWSQSSFATRRRLLKILLKYVVENQEIICR